MDSDRLIDGMNEYYARRAPVHDELMSYRSVEQMEKIFAPVIALLEPMIDGRDILEIACGTGNWTQVLAKRGRHVTATDVNRSMLELAREKEYTPTSPKFVESNAYTLDDVEQCCEVAFMADWWAHIPLERLSSFLENLHRKLLPNGIVIVLDMLPRELPEGETEHFDEQGNRIRTRTLPDGSRFQVVKNFPARQELSDLTSCYADEFHYWQFADLKRWLLVYQLR